MSRLSERLWESTEELRQDILNTKFIQGLKNGSLDPVKFGNYAVQDVVFCYRAEKNIDTIIARSSGELRDFMKKQKTLVRQYGEIQRKECSIQDTNGVYINPACRAYIEFLTNVAQSHHPIYYLVAFLPCMRLWPWLGDQLRQSESNFGVYQSWVDNYFAGDYYLSWEDLFNKSTVIDEEIAQDVYRECMKDELEFFNSVFLAE